MKTMFCLLVLVLTQIGLAQDCDTGVWTEIPTIGNAPSQSGCHMVYDEVSQQIIVVDQSGMTWSWDDGYWELLGHMGATSVVDSMCFDAARGEVVAYLYNGQTWIWNGSTWTRRSTIGPLPRYVSAMAFDSARSRVVLFGGYSGSNVVFRDTWEWSGVLWIERNDLGLSEGGSQTGRAFHSMAFDPSLSQVLLFGGRPTPGPEPDESNQAWSWSGLAWTRQSNGPGARYYHRMVTDTARGKIILYGGVRFFRGQNGNLTSQCLGDTWEWDGDWVPIGKSGPGARYVHAMAYDTHRGRTVLYGGYSCEGLTNSVWVYTPVGSVTVTEPPTDLVRASGSQAQFSVEAAGGGTLTYQWRLDGVPLVDSERITGSMTQNLTISDLSIDDVGRYDVVISNQCSTLTSATARLVVTVQPCPGDSDGNGVIGFDDLTTTLVNWDLICP